MELDSIATLASPSTKPEGADLHWPEWRTCGLAADHLRRTRQCHGSADRRNAKATFQAVLASAKLPAEFRHKLKSFIHHRTLLPTHPLPPYKKEKL